MLFRPCDCETPRYYDRLPRSPWMRLFFTRRLFRCMKCGAVMLIPGTL
jgi:hypothetical protein